MFCVIVKNRGDVCFESDPGRKQILKKKTLSKLASLALCLPTGPIGSLQPNNLHK